MNQDDSKGRALLVWAALLVLSVCVIVEFAAYGDRVIRYVEAQRLLKRSEDLVRANRLDEAVVLLARAVEAKADFFPARRLLVKTLLRSGRFAEAVAQAHAGVRQAAIGDRRDAWLLLGEVHCEAASWNEATSAYKRAQALDPNSREARLGLAKVADSLAEHRRMTQVSLDDRSRGALK